MQITYGYKQGKNDCFTGSVSKKTTNWLRNHKRPRRDVVYIDLSRLQPVGTRVGYARIAKNKHDEKSSTDFTMEQVASLSEIIGKPYDGARMAKATIDINREISVLSKQGDQGDQKKDGCVLLPGGDAPERVLFAAFTEEDWVAVGQRINLDGHRILDDSRRVMTNTGHHMWIENTAKELHCSPDSLWVAMCYEWVKRTSKADIQYILDAITIVIDQQE